jgi:cytoskeletal protein RodZ
MAKREIEDEPLSEELGESDVPTVGERLRAAREEKGLSLDDIAAQTRIPQRHLESIETADWEKLPAPTYTVGFAKSYASAVGLDRTDIGEQLREEMGGQRFASSQSEVIEAADPARTMPKSLVLGAVAAVIVIVVLMTWLNNRSLEQPNAPASTAPAAVATANAPARKQQEQQPALAPAPPVTAQGPVVLTATAPAWVRVTDQGKKLFEATMQPGQTYQVPQTASAPMLRVGAPEALRITVGQAVAPQVGPPGQATTVSLNPADLMHGGQPAPAPGTGAPQPPPNPTGQ